MKICHWIIFLEAKTKILLLLSRIVTVINHSLENNGYEYIVGELKLSETIESLHELLKTILKTSYYVMTRLITLFYFQLKKISFFYVI